MADTDFSPAPAVPPASSIEVESVDTSHISMTEFSSESRGSLSRDPPTSNECTPDSRDSDSPLSNGDGTRGSGYRDENVSIQGTVEETEQKTVISDSDIVVGTTETTETMFRRSPDGSPASPRTTSPVTKRVHFQDTFEDEDGLPMSHKEPCLELKNYRKADTQWYDKDNRLKPRPKPKSALKESESIFMLQETTSPDSKADSGFTAIIGQDSLSVNDNEDATSHKPRSQSEKRSRAFPPAPFVKGSLREQSACHWGCCCTFGWFMLGVVALSAGAVLVAYLKGYWLAEENSFERSLLYFGAALCAIGGLSLITGLAFFIFVTLIWQPGSSSDEESKDRDLTRSKYVVNNKSSVVEIEPISTVGNGHVIQHSDVTIIESSSTSYVPDQPSFPIKSDYKEDQ